MRQWIRQNCPSGQKRWLGAAFWELLLWSPVLWGLLLCTACKSGSTAPFPAQNILSNTCRPIGSSHALALQLTAPAEGVLRVEVTERGISTVSLLNQTTTSASASPIDRLGTVVLTASVHPGERTELDVRAEDSHDVQGEACVSAELIPLYDTARIGAEAELAAAGRAIHKSDWNSAFSRYLNAAREFDQLGLRTSAGLARHSMARLAYLRFDRKRDALALASAALADYGVSGDPLLVGALAGLEAAALLDMPDMSPAAVAPTARGWLETERRYEGTSPFGARELPRVEIFTGYLEYQLNAIEAARKSFTLAAKSCRDLGDWDCYGVASQNLARISEESKDYSVALSAYADALQRLPQELDPKLVADIWNNMGRLQGVVGLFSASEHSHQAAMQAYARLGDCQGIRRSLVRVGNLLLHVGNLADAEVDLVRAASVDCPALLAITTTLDGHIRVPVPVTSPSWARGASRESSQVDPAHPCARPLDPTPLTQESKAIVFSSLLALGEEATLTGHSAEIWRCLDGARAFVTNNRNQLRLANARGAAFLERNDPTAARNAFVGALQLADRAGLSATSEDRRTAQLGLVKSMLAAKQTVDGLNAAKEALAVNTASGDIESTITSLRLIAAGYRDSGRVAAAVCVLQVAADLIEAVPIDELDGEQRATFLASQHTVFAELTDIFASQTDTDPGAAWSAFAASERGRARSLRYALNQETRNASPPVEAPPAAKYQRLLGEVASVAAHSSESQSRDALIDEIDQLALREVSPNPPFDRIQLGTTLGQLDATLVEYASALKEMLAFVVSGRSARVIHLGEVQAIARATAQLRDRLHDSETPASEVQAAAESLARLIWWPLTPYLDARRIVVVPDDALHTVPLAVLPWSARSSDGAVVQHVESAVIPSALFLVRVHPTASGHSVPPHIGLVGDPVFRTADWRRECTDRGATQKPLSLRSPGQLSSWTESLPRLPGTRLEIDAISRLARESRPASRIETLVGCTAVPSALRKLANANLDLLHIATHARIDAQRPRLSALALSPELPSEAPSSTFGLLDILGLKLNSRLVVLSAGDTSRGRLLPGEGVLGPAQAFLQAGSAAVLASYWKVDDQITSTFMQRFYKFLLVDRLSASAALRKTQLESAASGKTYAWAAFSLYGWPDSSI